MDAAGTLDRVSGGRTAPEAAAKLHVRVQSNGLVIGEAIAAALRDVAGGPVVADTTDPTQARKTIHRPDVVIVLGSRADGSTRAAVKTARRRWRQAIIIALAETERVEDGLFLLRQGADSWLSPNEGLEALRTMVRRIKSGDRILLPPDALGQIASALGRPATADEPEAAGRLTSREGQVLECFAQGLSRPDIAAMLGISLATLRTHVQNILRKLDLHSIQQAAALAQHEDPEQRANPS